jgi:hypothetical protein
VRVAASITPHDLTVLGKAMGPGPWAVGDLHRLGLTRGQVRHALDTGLLVRLRRGLVGPRAAHAPDGAPDRALLLTALRAGGDSAALSHSSAAMPQRLWLPRGVDTSSVHVTVPGVPERHDGGVRVHGTRLRADLVHDVDGMRMTTPARTAVDLARGRRLPHALVSLDSAARLLALRHGLTDRDLRDPRLRASAHAPVVATLIDAYRSLWGLPGTVVVREALPLVSLGSESPLESESRGWMLLEGLPAPVVCYHVQGRSGRWYVADFAWPDARVLGEADGAAKYGATGAAVARALREERARQHDLEAAGWAFVRWDARELPHSAMDRLRHALAAATPSAHVA